VGTILALALSVAFAAAFWQVPIPKNTQPQADPSQLISEVVTNELRTQENDHSLWRYKQIQRFGENSEELEVIDTPAGSIHRILKRNGQPLSPEEAGKEDDRIRRLVENPKEIQKRSKDAEKDAEQEFWLLKMFPSAFEFHYSSNSNKDGIVQLEFSPQPSFKPQRKEGQVFHHMAGSIFIRLPQKRLVAIQGRLFSEVKFFDGILGYLAKGGIFDVRQSDVGGGHWEMTRLFINMHGKALFFKTIAVNQDEEDSDFRPVQQNITLAEAAEMLKKVENASTQSPRRSASN
jgi:hypothetical protein